MVLDIDEFREEKGGNPELIKENQRKRFCDEGMVDKIILCDNMWREGETIRDHPCITKSMTSSPLTFFN